MLRSDSSESINRYTTGNNNALHKAIKTRRNIKDISLALESGNDPNAPGKDGNTALHLAAQIGNTDIVKLLLRNGVLLNAKNDAGNTPLHKATRALLFYTNPPLHWTIYTHRIRAMERLLQQTASVDVQNYNDNILSYTNPSAGDDTAKSALEIILLFIRLGARYNIKNNAGEYATDCLPEALQESIKKEYRQLNNSICTQLALGSLPESQQLLVAEEWRTLGESRQTLVCLLLGLEPPKTVERIVVENKFSDLLKRIPYLPQLIQQILQKNQVKEKISNSLFSHGIDSSFYKLLEAVPTLHGNVQIPILKELLEQLDPLSQTLDATTVAPLLQLPNEKTQLTLESFVSILMKYLPKAFNRYSETFLQALKEKISTELTIDTQEENSTPTISRRP